MDNMLFVIPARGGSKGIKDKNIIDFQGEPLINHTLREVQKVCPNNQICISSDSKKIISKIQKQNYKPKFIRPDYLSDAEAATRDVILHALEFYKNFDFICLLQPTSPLRNHYHIKEAIRLFKKSRCELLMSVCESKSNPENNLFKEENGRLKRFSNNSFKRRQDVAKYFTANGAIYIFKKETILIKDFSAMTDIVPYEMKISDSIDIDSLEDLKMAEAIAEYNLRINSNSNFDSK